MQTIGELWEDNDEKIGLRVRWSDWGRMYSYFEIQGHDTQKGELFGTLNTGENIAYKLNSRNWKLYKIGDELCTRAV